MADHTSNRILAAVDHRPYALPSTPWRMSQRWNDLLFAHWPIPASEIELLLPAGVEVDTFDGYAWVGVVPFWMDRVRTRVAGSTALTVPGTGSFPELNLRTYVCSRLTGQHGVYFFSLDAASPLAVLGARMLFHLPYYLAWMKRITMADYGTGTQVEYTSRRLFARHSARFEANYRGLGRGLGGGVGARPSVEGSLEHFLTERYCLFTAHRDRTLVGDIHHLPWPLEPAEADIRINELPAAHGIVLPGRAPVLHFARELEVYIWPLREDAPLPGSQ